MFDRRSVEIVQFGHVQVLRVAFGGDAGFLVPHEILQVEAAAHRRPARRAHGNVVCARLQIHTVLQFEVERAADVERVDNALPTGFVFVQPARRIDFQFVAFVVQRHTASAADTVVRAGTADEQVDRVHRGRRFARQHDAFALELGVERAVDVRRTFEFEIEGVYLHQIDHAERARAAVQIGFQRFEAV